MNAWSGRVRRPGICSRSGRQRGPNGVRSGPVNCPDHQYLHCVIKNIPSFVVMKGCLTTWTRRNGPTFMLAKLVLVVHMDIHSIIPSFQILYTVMYVLWRMVSTVVAVAPYTGNGLLGQIIMMKFICQYIFNTGYMSNVLRSRTKIIHKRKWEGKDIILLTN